MRVKKILILLVLGWSLSSVQVQAEEEEKTIKELDPVIYEKLEFKKNTDYLHDVKKTEMKNTIPEKQFNIYFDGRKKLPNRSDTSYLFLTAERGEKSTVAAKTSELKLFSDGAKENSELMNTSMEEIEPSGNKARTFIFLAILVVGLVTLFIVIVPRMVQSEVSKKTMSS